MCSHPVEAVSPSWPILCLTRSEDAWLERSGLDERAFLMALDSLQSLGSHDVGRVVDRISGLCPGRTIFPNRVHVATDREAQLLRVEADEKL